ncbi:hypothetical protein EX30DRAFT_304845 [Ascodesmis nigricans]|uniref:Small ribosomal subunit protein mS35 mitochondrial conserved domain-containing protein n=1 Tax=Ascodesmis nigricans TaxID=341454 RepID=A0A4S2N1J4_9PEZI|nr:hypothetical protein EX30DRAFT_304845 [Ascodesmis nigricans]
MEFEDFKFDDISSIGHGQLEQHREIRQYARVMAYEMPRLFDLAKPFEAPTGETPLRFRYTTYMGEEFPAQAKVVVEFSPADLPLTEQEQHKLIKLVRMRYNPDTHTVKMACERFEHPAQNKRYLLDKIDELVTEAKDKTDTFEDIPFDFRHHKPKKMPVAFPEEWIEIAKQKEQERLARQASAADPLSQY